MVNNLNTRNKKISVLVVGAGPAGVSAAFFLKHYDTEDTVTVTLAERLDDARYPVYHAMCGEAVSQFLCRDVEPLRPGGFVEKIHLMKDIYPGNIVLTTKTSGYIINRAEFLKSIIGTFEKAGGIYTNATVKNLVQDNQKVTVAFEHGTQTFDYVIAADGPNSQIRSSLGIEGKKIKVIQYIVDKKPSRGLLEFYYDEAYEGNYKYIFPHENNVKIGFPVLPGKKFEPKEEIIQKQVRYTACGGVKRYVIGRVLLVGDAACQTNILTKGGIRAGMVAGKMAAKALNLHRPQLYEESWKKSGFSSDIFQKAFLRLQSMKNPELESHIRPFYEYQTSASVLKSGKLWMDLVRYHHRYLGLYNAYKATETYGW